MSISARAACPAHRALRAIEYPLCTHGDGLRQDKEPAWRCA